MPFGADKNPPKHDPRKLLRFLSAGAQTNVLGHGRSALPSVASGVSRHISFPPCSESPFPPTAEGVARRSAIFRHGGAYAPYISHLGNACHRLGIDNSWEADIIASLGAGLRNNSNNRVRLRNSLTPESPDRAIRPE